ncbi:peptidase M75 [Bradymonadaceae bacterium TMQ3]|uniref:Peptidase M75 n=1 Tax=Lujinxingia sediminis TaxID=2480984 RepID=A0ABY0CVM6_9DELT|nr:imelysin family protein [Lujinxingia sediminis]RDV37178.1 peptidase M75 [Bradymonadaceae bacterium TMQ3]RVU46874.1 peptidase M75 [Lujinxingia sediminis]TXC74882.1 peptidase M75 [Bradymonadales bacterium TMQ1]
MMLFKKSSIAMMTLGAGLMMGCGDDGGDTVVEGEAFDNEQILIDTADQVIVPTYELLNTRASALVVAVDAFVLAPTDITLEAAQDAWKATREPWEQSEGFLFGPVDAAGIDPALDSWPVEKAELDGVLASDDELTETYVASLDVNKKGFHAVEYLLFGQSSTKSAADFTEREFDYLVASANELQANTEYLADAWTEGVDGQPAYRDIFVSAGDADNAVYPSRAAAAQEIVEGLVGILDEVANGKIGDPYTEQDTLLVESQFAFNSLSDFKDNMRSVQNAYLGRVEAASTSGSGLTVFVSAKDSELDDKVKVEIQATIDALDQIAEPFRDSITDEAQATHIEAAQAAILQLMNTLDGEVKPLVLGQ